MTAIRVALSRAVSSFALSIASFFESSVDRIIADFIALDGKLEAYIDRKAAEQDRLLEELTRSLDRQDAVESAERTFRSGVNARLRSSGEDAVRAARIREAVQNLIG